MERSQIWADDGSQGFGFIHAPRVPHFVISGTGPARFVGVRRVSGRVPAVIATLKGGALSAPGGGETLSGTPWTSPIAALDGQRYASTQDLAEAIHAATGYPVAGTANGGTYALLAGKRPA